LVVDWDYVASVKAFIIMEGPLLCPGMELHLVEEEAVAAQLAAADALGPLNPFLKKKKKRHATLHT
jgi:hypothetical protein